MHPNTILRLSALLPLASPSAAIPNRRSYVEDRDGILHNISEDPVSGVRMSFVNNSGICETTPAVNHYSGYVSMSPSDNMWFWLFEARENPDQAPLVLYFGGGPGCSSMMGTFINNGPCRFDSSNQSEPSLNPYSFNTYANMLYVDQPIPTGFSYGNGTEPRSTKEAAVAVYDFLQAFYDRFPAYQGRAVGIFTSSYGGHYGPEFARFILEKNGDLAAGDGTDRTARRHEIRVAALGLDNAWVDAAIQERSNIDFARENEYRPLINGTLHADLVRAWEAEEGGPGTLFAECAATGADAACHDAWMAGNSIDIGIVSGFPAGAKTFDVRPGAQSVPSAAAYLQREDVRRAIGAGTPYVECAWPRGFADSGDDARSFLGELSAVVSAGVKTLIWTGDADFACNWHGTSQVAHAIDWPGREAFAGQDLEPYTVGGEEKAGFKTQDNLTLMRVYEAGHQMTWYQIPPDPDVALQVFKQFMGSDGLSST
ncbi:hypothetical protein SLS62_008599 [Diatrype stigma]|uniref:Uncharacterized protein n=1 Tax=Diatrype stigma TaxID=117547 RepID=A0AAN9YKD4_9PEZI